MTPINPANLPALEPSPTVVPLRHRGLSDVTSAAVDLADLNSPHTLAALSVPPGAVVLDVGCGPGIVSRALAERGCRVYGIEIDSRKAAVARASCVEVVEADLETASLAALFVGQRFDAILCLDVLEHLKNPVAVLTELRAMLAPGGAVLISVPNVTHGALRLELLQGRFGYRSSGLLDRGHLRFFDGRALADLVRDAGFFAETTLRVIRRLDQTEFEIDLDTVPEAVRESLERDPDALTYQFFVVARPVRDGQPRNEATSLPERLRARLDLVTAELDKAGIYARSLEAELKQRNSHLQNLTAQETRIAQLSAELTKASDYARHLEAEIAKRDERMLELEALGLATRTHANTLEAELGRAGTYARGLEERLSASQSRAEALASALQSRQEQADGFAAAAVTREGIVEDLQRLLDDQVSYARYLEAELRKRAGELALYDDEVHVLRAHVQKTEAAIAELQGRIEVGDRDVEHREDQLRVMRLELTVAEGALGERDDELARAARESAEDRQRLAEVTRLLDRYRVRLATRGADAFVQKTPGLYRVLRGVLATVLERWRPTEFQR
jgi:2-polyprenyl-3-methyl-5-hydroxy-6-metoxy-1,4-benzoquinol methylase